MFQRHMKDYIVANAKGIELIPLTLKVMHEIGPGNFNNILFDSSIKELVKDGSIIEMIAETSPFVEKRLYFPPGTKFNFKSKE